ncbi:phosphotransferase [Bacillus sp. FJAT-27251]|uniref:phosphotransferase n=1 Tax=Bacillus sp. FJAT-27251 TaxID=1684142 RepID=UPI0018D00FF0|nr:phosphotransferase [Bacillus sp. FJAT-27251]
MADMPLRLDSECRAKKTLTKAMNIKFHPRRDDSTDRLFSYLQSALPVRIETMTKIRDRVFLLRTGNTFFMLKAYSSEEKLQQQQVFTAALREAGFSESYTFLKLSDQPLFFENAFYGCQEYIPPSSKPFNYLAQTEREEGLGLLAKYHMATRDLVPEFRLSVPKQDIWQKWQERAAGFKRNTKIVNYFVQKQLTAEILDWSELALEGMAENLGQLYAAEPVILHGDVAHHNFLRDETGRLCLIDFDLISLGPETCDLLQYANRILPFMNWSLESLSAMKGFSGCLSNKAFLYGLMYPADIFREWNRIIRLKAYYNPARTAPLIELTVNQFNARKRFIEKVKKLTQE